MYSSISKARMVYVYVNGEADAKEGAYQCLLNEHSLVIVCIYGVIFGFIQECTK